MLRPTLQELLNIEKKLSKKIQQNQICLRKLGANSFRPKVWQILSKFSSLEKKINYLKKSQLTSSRSCSHLKKIM
jgi:hypothetical protein